MFFIYAGAAAAVVSWTVLFFAGCACLLSRKNKKLTWTAAGLLLLAAAYLGGGLLMRQFGLAWRVWLRGVFLLALGGLMLRGAALTVREMANWWGENSRKALLCQISGLLAGFLLVCFGVGCAVVGSWTDRVTDAQGQKAVEETTGIFRVTGYRYVNPFVRGEELYTWAD
jgi:uncharacterized membrane protein YfcA